MIGIGTTPLGLLRRQVWLQAFPLIVCQISSCYARSVPARAFCKHALVSAEILEKHATPELAYVVEIERGEAEIGGSEDVTPWALRATMIFRPEEGTWKIVHRHADPITTAQAAESLILN
jgi:hypothetical protein